MNTQRVQEHNIMPQLEKDEYIKVIQDMPWLYESILRELERHTDKIESVIDVACGDGTLLHLIHKKYPDLKLTGLDIDPYFIQRAKEKHEYEFHVADGYDFNFKADLIISNLAFHHFEDPVRLITHMLDAAKYGIIISDHVRPDTEEELESRLSKRSLMHNFEKSDYYKQKGKNSILEAYSKAEIMSMFASLKTPFDITFFDDDYFERFVGVLLK